MIVKAKDLKRGMVIFDVNSNKLRTVLSIISHTNIFDCKIIDIEFEDCWGVTTEWQPIPVIGQSTEVV